MKTNSHLMISKCSKTTTDIEIVYQFQSNYRRLPDDIIVIIIQFIDKIRNKDNMINIHTNFKLKINQTR